MERKPVPWRVRLTSPLPTGTLVGVIDVMVSEIGSPTVNGLAAEVPPPGVPLTTVIATLPATKRSEAIVAWISVALMKVVGTAVPFQAAVESWTNPVPVITRVKESPPAGIEVGESAEMLGAGFRTSKTWVAVLPPPNPETSGFVTAMVRLRAVARRFVGIVAVSCVDEDQVATAGVPSIVTVVPVVMAALPSLQLPPL